ncbi:MAG: MFS transporter [Candidatus Pararuminococcus gallinarum]|jgi:MFS family permease
MNKNVKRILALLAVGFGHGIIYLLPYMKTVFYDQMIAATGFTNAQLGQMMGIYGLVCTISYIPGGWVADRIKPKKLITWCCLLNGLLCFAFLFVYQNFALSMIIWLLCALTGGFAFWPAVMKGVRLLGSKEEQGRMYGVYEAINGGASMLASFLMVWISTWFADLLAGFRGAVISMGVLGVLSALLIWWLYDEHITYNEDASESENEKITVKEFFRVLIMPRVWIPALLLFGGIIMYDGMGYLTPWSTETVGISVALAGILGSIREYGCRLGGIGGGFMADKVLKSSAKWQVIAHLVCAVLAISFIGVAGLGSGASIVIMLLFGLAVYANRVTAYSLLTEFHIPTKVAGTAIALVSMVGYIPDMFIHTLFGSWLDAHGANGYSYIFIFLAATGVVCACIALVAVSMSKKINRAKSETEVIAQ